MTTDKPNDNQMHHPASNTSGDEWFALPDNDTGQTGLSFSCTMCGDCCSGPGGYVLFTQQEAAELASHLGVTLEVFYRDYTQETAAGISLAEKTSERGKDCIFLDRERYPGRAVCGVYQLRPLQCRTWPFWRSNVASPSAWTRASAACPGMNKGQRYSPQQIRILRDTVEM